MRGELAFSSEGSMAVGVPVGGACGQQCENGLSVGTWTRGRGAWTGGCGWPDSRKAAWRLVKNKFVKIAEKFFENRSPLWKN